MAHIRPDSQGRARTNTRRRAVLGGPGAGAEWAHAGVGDRAQVEGRVRSASKGREKQHALLLSVLALKKKRRSRPSRKRDRGGADGRPADG